MLKNHLAMAVVATCILTGLVLGISYADDAAFTPTEIQALRLKVAQSDAKLARATLMEDQNKMQQDQQAFSAAINNLKAEGEKVKTENKWSEKVTFDMDKLTFTMPPEPPKAAEAKKP